MKWKETKNDSFPIPGSILISTPMTISSPVFSGNGLQQGCNSASTGLQQSCNRAATCVDMRWLRLVGSWKLQVSFAKEPNKRECILRKRHVIVRSLLIVANPYVRTCRMVSVWMQRATRLSTHIHGDTVQHTALHRNTDTIYIYVYVYTHIYGVASTSRLLKTIGLFCKRAL